jgi:hypothetical protein
MDRTRTLILPEELCRLAEQKFACRFGNLDELVTALLKQLVGDDPLRMDEREQRIVEERLKGLGYV